MSKKDDLKIYGLLKYFIEIVVERVHSNEGRVNIAFGILTTMVIIIMTIQPIALFVLQGIQSVLNFFILLFSPNPIQIPISESSISPKTILICLIILLIESVLCTIIVHWSQKEKKIINKNSD